MLHLFKSPLRGASQIIAGLLAVLLLASCAAAPARMADRYYDLDPQIAPISFGSNARLAVQSVSVKGLQSARPLVTLQSKSPLHYEEVRGHLWHVSPSTLWQRAVADSLSEASEDMAIGTTDTIDDEDYRLKLNVTKFHYIPNEVAVIDFEAILKNSRGKIVSVHRYQAEEPVAGGDVADAVMALQTAASATVSLLAKDIKAAL